MTHSFPTQRSSDLLDRARRGDGAEADVEFLGGGAEVGQDGVEVGFVLRKSPDRRLGEEIVEHGFRRPSSGTARDGRSEEHTSELQSLMRISYAVFCLKKKNKKKKTTSIEAS